MQNLATPLRPSEPAFLRENWKVLLGTFCPQKQAVVRVQGNVATITNGQMMIRSPLQQPDGFYQIAQSGELRMSDIDVWGYPDPMACYQPFEKMTPSPPFPTKMVHMLIQYLEEARRQRATVVLDKRGFATMSRNDPLVFDFVAWLGTEIPLRGEEMGFNPHLLKLAFVEMLRYSGEDKDRDACCYLSHFWNPERRTPLVIGHSWERCALIMPVGY